MERSTSTPAAGAAGLRRYWLSKMRIGIVMAALGLVATLILAPGGTGPSDTLAVAGLSGADLAVDSAYGPAVTFANDYADADRYVSANPFTALRNDHGGGANASFGFGRLTPQGSTPHGGFIECTAIVILIPEWGVSIDTGHEVCTVWFPGWISVIKYVNQTSAS